MRCNDVFALAPILLRAVIRHVDAHVRTQVHTHVKKNAYLRAAVPLGLAAATWPRSLRLRVAAAQLFSAARTCSPRAAAQLFSAAGTCSPRATFLRWPFGLASFMALSQRVLDVGGVNAFH